MNKNFYYLFGSKSDDIDSLSNKISDKMDLLFESKESDFIGFYMVYSGIYADRLTIEKNYNIYTGSWKEENFKEYPILLYFSNYKGRNKDKESKSKFLRHHLMQIEGLICLKEKIIES